MERQEPNRRTIGRERFIEKIWAWKADSGGTIINQLKRLGASCDWSRERFTMDEGLSKAVLKVFVELPTRRGRRAQPDLQGQAAGSLGSRVPERTLGPRSRRYRAHRQLQMGARPEGQGRQSGPVQCGGPRQGARPRSQRAHVLSPLSSWHGVAYNADDTKTFLTVGTTRPETMLGDTAVAVHPEDDALQASRRQEGGAAVGRAPHTRHRRRIFRSREGLRRGEDHAGARLQRLRGLQAPPRDRPHQHLRCQGAAQRGGAGDIPRPRPLRCAQARRCRPGSAGSRRQDRGASPMPCRTRSAATRWSSRG